MRRVVPGVLAAVLLAASSVQSSVASAPVMQSTEPQLSAEARAQAEARRTGKPVAVAGRQDAATSVVANPTGSFTATLKATSAPAAQFGVAGVPTPTDPAQAGWALVFSGHPGNPYWNGDGDGVAKVGQCYNANGDCDGIGAARSYFQYNTGWLNGREIISSSFRALEVHAPSCQARWVDAYGTWPVSGGTTWSQQPGVTHNLGGYNIAAGRSGCPAAYLEFNSADLVRWSTTPSNGLGTTTVMLRARDEGDQIAWKKFATTPVLSVTYNTRPNTPDGLAIENDRPCGTGANEVRVNPQLNAPPGEPSRGPRLWSTVSDPDGGSVAARYRVYERDHSTLVHSADTTGLNSPGRFSIDVPAALSADGRQLSYRVLGWDGMHESAAASAWCDVTIDRTAPSYAPNVTSPTYKECPDELTCPASGAVGFTGGFAFTSGGDTDLAGYLYTLEGAGPVGGEPQQEKYATIGADGVARALVTPQDDGPQTLIVRAVDKAGNASAVVKSFRFWVGRGTPPTAHWRLDGHGTDTAVVEDRPGRLDGVKPAGDAVAWRTGRIGDALWMNGSANAYVSTSKQSAIDTSKSFTVSAWLKLDEAGTVHRTAVSQDGSTISGFFLQYNPASRKWNFVLPATNADGAVRDLAESSAPAVAGRWTHLVGVFDDGAKQLRLYVDGVPGTTGSHPTPWAATGLAKLGAAQVGKQVVNQWLGSIDDVRLYQRVLTKAEIDDLAGRPSTEELFWGFDESTGGRVSDASGNYRQGALRPDASRTAGAVGSGAVRLDGSGLGIFPGVPVVRTDGSFTVSARVKLDAVDGVSRTILSQDGAQASGFQLSYRGDNRRWSFSLDKGGTVDSDQIARQGVWTELTAVYDQAAGQMRLYVDGEQPGAFALAQSSVNSTGTFRVGAGQQGASPLIGEIDDVHAWTGARTGDQILADHDQAVTQRSTPYGGQLARYATNEGISIVTNGPVPPGAHYLGSLGVPAPEGTAGTRTIYSCLNNTRDYFLSATCEGHLELGPVGQFWISKPSGIDTITVYRCYVPGVAHFASTDPNCEGATTEFLLGYTKAYSGLVRHLATNYPYDHLSSTARTTGNVRPELPLGYLSPIQVPGTTALKLCKAGEDAFSSTDASCEGETVVGSSGFIWTEPPTDRTSRPVYRCRTSWNDLFDSNDPNCEGQTVERLLGHVVVRP